MKQEWQWLELEKARTACNNKIKQFTNHKINHWSSFQLNVERNPGLLCFCFTSLCGWFRKLAPLFLTNQMQNYNKSRSDWLIKVISFLLIGCCDYFGFGFATLNTKALYSSTVYRLLPINKVLLVIYHFPPKFSVRTAIILSTEPNIARWMMTGLFFSSPSPLNHQMTQQQYRNSTTTPYLCAIIFIQPC